MPTTKGVHNPFWKTDLERLASSAKPSPNKASNILAFPIFPSREGQELRTSHLGQSAVAKSILDRQRTDYNRD